MKKQLFLAFAVAAMATACSKNDTTPNSEQTDDIMLKGGALSVDVKSPYEGEIAVDNLLKAQVIASITADDYTTPYCIGLMTFAGTRAVSFDNTDFTGVKSYPATGDVYLTGLYPYGNKTTPKWSTPTTTSEFTFTGMEDVMTAPQVKTNKVEGVANTYQNLAFDHKLTKLEFIVKGMDAATAEVWGTINEITLTHNGTLATFTNKATATLKDGKVVFSGTDVTSWPTYEITGGTVFTDDVFTAKTNVLTKDPVKVAYTLVVPVEATELDAEYVLSLKTTKDGDPQLIRKDIAIDLLKKGETTAFTGSTAGSSFVVTLTFGQINIKATASVTPWKDAGEADTTVD